MIPVIKNIFPPNVVLKVRGYYTGKLNSKLKNYSNF